MLLEVRDAPVAFAGSDGKTHLVYELRMTNFSSGNATIEQVEVIGDEGAVLKTMDKGEIAGRLQMAGQRTPTDVLPGSAEALLFIHLALADGAAVPGKLTHRVRVRVEAAPPGKQEFTEVGGETAVDRVGRRQGGSNAGGELAQNPPTGAGHPSPRQIEC